MFKATHHLSLSAAPPGSGLPEVWLSAAGEITLAEPGGRRIRSIKFHCGRAVLISQADCGGAGRLGVGCTALMSGLGGWGMGLWLKQQGPWLRSHQSVGELE